MARISMITAALLTLCLHKTYAQSCVRVDRCVCTMSDNSGDINLNSLASTTGQPRWIESGGDGWLYKYNPCVGFDTLFSSDLAVLQVHENNSYEEYTLGIQSTEDFPFFLSQETSVTYSDDLYYPVRSSKIILECIPDANAEHEFEVIGELIILEYDFILRGPCACPGMCDNDGIILPPTTTTPLTATGENPSSTISKQPCSNNADDSYWEKVGADIVSLIFHDLLLVVVIGFILVIVKFAFGYSCYFVSDQANKGKPFSEA